MVVASLRWHCDVLLQKLHPVNAAPNCTEIVHCTQQLYHLLVQDDFEKRFMLATSLVHLLVLPVLAWTAILAFCGGRSMALAGAELRVWGPGHIRSLRVRTSDVCCAGGNAIKAALVCLLPYEHLLRLMTELYQHLGSYVQLLTASNFGVQVLGLHNVALQTIAATNQKLRVLLPRVPLQPTPMMYHGCIYPAAGHRMTTHELLCELLSVWHSPQQWCATQQEPCCS